MPDEPTLEQQLAWSEVVHVRLFGKCWHWAFDPPAHQYGAGYDGHKCELCGQILPPNEGYGLNDTLRCPQPINYCLDWNHAMPVHLAMTKHGLRERYLEQLGLIGENEQSFFDEPHHIVQAAAEVLQEETSDAT